MTRVRHLEVVAARKGKGGGTKDEEISSVEGWSEEEQEQEACEKKGKNKCTESGDVDADSGTGESAESGEEGTDVSDETGVIGDGGYWNIIEGAEESLPPGADGPNTESPTAETSETDPVDLTDTTSTPSVIAIAVSPTETPITESDTPTFKPTAAVPVAPTEVPVASTLAPTFAVTSTTDGQPSTGDGMFDGEDFFHNHLVPFAVSIEGDDVTNDLGITSCLLTEMQRNMTSLFNLEMENFTIVEFSDEDGDGFKRFELYFSGFGEYVGLPKYTQEYSEEVQLNVLGDGVEFYQTCLNARWSDSGKSFTASQLVSDQDQQSGQNPGNNVDGVKGNENADNTQNEVGDDDSQLETNLIIGLVVGGVVVALAGIVFASRVLSRNREAEDENSKLIEGQEEEN